MLLQEFIKGIYTNGYCDVCLNGSVIYFTVQENGELYVFKYDSTGGKEISAIFGLSYLVTEILFPSDATIKSNPEEYFNEKSHIKIDATNYIFQLLTSMFSLNYKKYCEILKCYRNENNKELLSEIFERYCMEDIDRLDYVTQYSLDELNSLLEGLANNFIEKIAQGLEIIDSIRKCIDNHDFYFVYAFDLIKLVRPMLREDEEFRMSDFVNLNLNHINKDKSDDEIIIKPDNSTSDNISSNLCNMDETDNRHSQIKTKIEKLEELNIPYEILNEREYYQNPAIAREEEIKKLELALLTLTRSPILVGNPGVGKTAVVEGFAYLTSQGVVPNYLKNRKVLKIDIPSLVSGCELVGSFEKKMDGVLQYLSNNTDMILFLDEMHTAIGAGTGSKSNIDLANILKPYLDRGKIKIIGCTTEEEYQKYLAMDGAFRRRFEKINVLEPEDEFLIEILIGYIEKLTCMMHVTCSDSFYDSVLPIIVEATRKEKRVYDDMRYNPDLAISIIEKAFALAAYDNTDTLGLNHFSIAIQMCDVLYPSVREEYAKKIESLSLTNEQSPSCRILFPKRS